MWEPRNVSVGIVQLWCDVVENTDLRPINEKLTENLDRLFDGDLHLLNS